MGSNPGPSRKALSIQWYTHVGVGQIKSIVYHPTQEFHQPVLSVDSIDIILLSK